MEVKDLKWYSPFVFLVGAILSFADPITDILTLVEFYRNDYKTWFGVGLAFVILPCLLFSSLVYFQRGEGTSTRINCTRAIICGLHPFSAALAKLEGFAFSLKKWWRGDHANDAGKIEKGNNLLVYIYMFVLFESALESAPQFILQLYAMNAQEEPVQIIQMISLPVSFLSLNWAFVNVDELFWFDGGELGDLTLRRKSFIFLTHFFLLISRLFAVCYFTLTYKWWVIVFLLFHTFAITMGNTIYIYARGNCEGNIQIMGFFFLGLHWLRDDMLVVLNGNFEIALLKVLISNHVLFAIENFVMILMFYFSQHSNSWFSLLVTVCVCSFSVIGNIMRIAGLYVFSEQERGKYVMDPQSNSSNNSAPAEMMYWTSTV